MKPVQMNVDEMTCTQCPWRHHGEDWAAWWSHTEVDHPSYWAFLRSTLTAIGDTGPYDTSYEEACLRLAGKIWLQWQTVKGCPGCGRDVLAEDYDTTHRCEDYE